MAEAYIVEAVRSAIGRRNGSLAHVHPVDLGGSVLTSLVTRSGVDPAAVEDVIMGCVTQAGEQALAFARSCVLASSLPETVPAVTIDRQCGSSQQSIHFAAQAVMSGTQDIVIAAGTESMSRVPVYSNQSYHNAAGVGIGPFPPSVLGKYGVTDFSQFTGAQMLADKYGYTREQLDAYALESHRRAGAAIDRGDFQAEIVPVVTPEGIFAVDEGVRRDTTLEKLASLRTLSEGGLITAGSSSQISDGSSALMVVSERALKDHGLTPMARITQLAVTAGDPVIMVEEPINAARVALRKAGLSIADIDLFEVNEAFAPVPMAWREALGVDPDRLNVSGGAIALGHPLGATGTRIMATLIHGLRRRSGRYGLQAICEAGGIANATIVELL